MDLKVQTSLVTPPPVCPLAALQVGHALKATSADSLKTLNTELNQALALQLAVAALMLPGQGPLVLITARVSRSSHLSSVPSKHIFRLFSMAVGNSHLRDHFFPHAGTIDTLRIKTGHLLPLY